MKVALSQEKRGVLAVAGHAGCGHCHSHNQYIQDDSGGLATVLALFQEATGLSLVIKDIKVQTGSNGCFEVETEGGGHGKAFARRGITLQEARLAQTLIGREAVRTQTLALEAFGRFYGQGIHEAPVALQTAIANAALDTFVRAFPAQFAAAYEDLAGSCGLMAGTVLDFDGVPVTVLGTVNASQGGIGPNEDLEGNTAVGSKGQLMARLGMMDLPTIVVEGKVFTPAYSLDIDEPTFLVRADTAADNPVVAASIVQAAQTLGFLVKFRDDVMVRQPDGLAQKTRELGQKIVALGTQLQEANFAQDKINILAELAELISQDGAGISFMTNRLHEIVGGVGLMPGTAAVFNYIVPVWYQRQYIFPFMTEQDVHRFVALTKQAVKELYKVLPEASNCLRQKQYPYPLDRFVRKGGN